MPPRVEERHRVVYLDGIHLGRGACVPVACTDDAVLGWHLCRDENSRAWAALVSRIAAPEVAVSDGGDGLAKALRREWPATRVQRCVFHAFCQVRRYTTSRPNLQAGAELYGIAKALLSVSSPGEANAWAATYLDWCGRWSGFLSETTVDARGRRVWTHVRLVKARGSLSRLVSAGTLFTYLDPALTVDGPLPSTNNRIEGGVNAQLRGMLRDHRGMVWRGGPRRYSGGATSTRRARCRRRRSSASCPRTGASRRYTVGSASARGSRAPSPGGGTPSSGRSCTTRSRGEWTGTSRTHILSYNPLFTHIAAALIVESTKQARRFWHLTCMFRWSQQSDSN